MFEFTELMYSHMLRDAIELDNPLLLTLRDVIKELEEKIRKQINISAVVEAYRKGKINLFSGQHNMVETSGEPSFYD